MTDTITTPSTVYVVELKRHVDCASRVLCFKTKSAIAKYFGSGTLGLSDAALRKWDLPYENDVLTIHAHRVCKSLPRDKVHPNAQQVKCLETGEVFGTMASLAQAVGLKPSSLTCRMKRAGGVIQGLHYVYLTKDDEIVKPLEHTPDYSRMRITPVLCEETLRVYGSIQRLAEDLNVYATKVNRYIEAGDPIRGQHYYKIGDGFVTPCALTDYSLICIDTMTLYRSHKSLAQVLGVTRQAVGEHMSGAGIIKGKQYKPFSDYLAVRTDRAVSIDTKRTTKPVRCLETGEEYPSVKALAAAINAHPVSVSHALRCSDGRIHGRHYIYVDQ